MLFASGTGSLIISNLMYSLIKFVQLNQLFSFFSLLHVDGGSMYHYIQKFYYNKIDEDK